MPYICEALALALYTEKEKKRQLGQELQNLRVKAIEQGIFLTCS